MIYEGNVAWVYPDHFDVDLIIGMQNTRERDISKLVPICMSAYEEGFSEKVSEGDFLVAGRNFGYGHAHNQVAQALRMMGINTLVAESFAPGFFRAEVGNGMALLAVPGITEKVNRNDRLKVDFVNGIVENLTSGETIQGTKPGDVIIDLVRNGGNNGFLKEKLSDPEFK